MGLGLSPFLIPFYYFVNYYAFGSPPLGLIPRSRQILKDRSPYQSSPLLPKPSRYHDVRLPYQRPFTRLV